MKKIIRRAFSNAANARFGVSASSTGSARDVPPAAIRNLRRENSTITGSSWSLAGRKSWGHHLRAVAEAVARRDADQQFIQVPRCGEALDQGREGAGVGLFLDLAHCVAEPVE